MLVMLATCADRERQHKHKCTFECVKRVKARIHLCVRIYNCPDVVQSSSVEDRGGVLFAAAVKANPYPFVPLPLIWS
jgi:hypothetical protein